MQLARVVFLAGILGFASELPASPEGHAAADQVSVQSYKDFLNYWLYTHWGDDRGFGPEHDLAQANIVFLLESFGIGVELEPFTYDTNVYYNIVGTKLGTTYPEQEFIIGAHYDSVGNPGADDDASGVALLLEVARIISQYDSEYTIRFVAFDREEQGLVGSDAYVAEHIDDDILGMIQADMICWDEGTNHVRIRGTAASLPHKMDVLDAVLEYSDGLTASDNGPMCASDHCPFEQAGFQACLVIEEVFNPHWHDPDDVFEILGEDDFLYASRIVRSLVGYLVDHAVVDVLVELCSADLNGDDQVGPADLAMLLANWGRCEGCAADFNGDSTVDATDLAQLLASWGPCD